MKTLLKKYAISALLLSAGGLAVAADKNVNQELTANTDWADLEWDGGGTMPTAEQSADVTISNTGYDVTISGGEEYAAKNFRLLSNTRLVIGGAGDAASLTVSGQSELQSTASIVVKSNGSLVMTGSTKLQFYNYNDMSDDGIALLVDGGKVYGTVQTGSNYGSGTARVVFRNGATLTRNNEVNPNGMAGRSELTFDASTYNVYNDWDTNKGWGNHSFNIGTDNTDTSVATQMKVVFDNKSVLNGAGIVDEGTSTVQYYNFSDPITTSGISAVDLTLQIGRLANTTDSFSFSILNGSKVSAKNFKFGSDNNDAVPRRTSVGTITFEMEGKEGAKSMYVGFGGTNIYLSNAHDNGQEVPISAQWNFLLKGRASYDTTNDFNVNDGNILGGTLNFAITGEDNYFNANNLNINGGSNNYQGLNSKANINMLFGSDGNGAEATNSSFNFNALNVTAGGDSNINVKFSGATNTFAPRSHAAMTNSTVLGGNSVSRIEVSDGLTATVANQVQLNNKASGLSEFAVSNGANLTYNNLNFNASTYEGGSAESYLVVDGGSFTSSNDIGYSANGTNAAKSGKMGIKMTGDGGSFLAGNQMNVHNTDADTTGGFFIIDIAGANNTFENRLNLHFSGQMHGDGGYLFSMSGSGNTAKISTAGGDFNLGNTTSTAGLYRLEMKGSDASAKNSIYLGGESGSGAYILQMEGAMVADSSMAIEFVMAGNSVLKRGNGEGVHLKMHEFGGKDYLSGTALFEVGGSGNEALFSNLQVGNEAASGGVATFRIRGGGSDIRSTGALHIRRGLATSWENPVGAILEFAIDDTGISAITVDSSNIVFSGLLSLDFANLTGTFDNERFVLITANDASLQGKLANWITDFSAGTVSELVKIGKRADDDIVAFKVEENADGYYDFAAYYTSTVPEPAAFAALFGAAALACAMSRRRKN